MPVHFFQVLFREYFSQLPHDFHFLLVASWLEDAHEESRRNAKPKDAVNVSPHDFQVEQRREQLLKVEVRGLHDSVVDGGEVYFQLRFQRSVLVVSF